MQCILSSPEMGNQINNHHHHHPHVRKNPYKCRQSTVSHPTCTPSCSESILPINAPDGSRIINLDKLGKFVNTFTQHILSCPQSALLEGTQAVAIEGESQQGLTSIIGIKCNGCNTVLKLETSTKVTCPRGSR